MPDLSRTFATRKQLYGESASNNTYEGVVAKNPGSVATQLFVTIPAIDRQAMHGPCKWTPRVDDAGATVLPVIGDTALITISEDGNPWVIAWWPA